MCCPFVPFGSDLPKRSSNFTQLNKVGDSLQFRILGFPFAEGNHFLKTEDGNWDVQPCPRINHQDSCEHCETFFRAIRSIPKTEDKKEYNKLRDEVKESLPKGTEVTITWNYPVINRETGEYTVYKATPGIRSKIENEASLDVPVLEVDFKVKNTGKPGKDRYAFSRVDSSDTKPLTAAEEKIKAEYDPAKLEAQIAGTPDDESATAIQANTDEVKVDDIPF
jgi:hypothetical protein